MKIFEKEELKLLWPFYLETFFSHILFFVPAFWVIQLQQSMTLTQIGILFSVLSLTSFLFEIPTGAFADIYGRKKSTLLGMFLMAISASLIFFVHSFYFLIPIFILWGISITFISGAYEAWVVDRLKEKKKDSLIKEYYLKTQSILRLSLFLSGFLGALIVSKLGLNSIWIFGGASFIIQGIILSFVSEKRITKDKKQSFKDLIKQAQQSIRFSLKHNILLFLLIATFFIVFRDAFGGDLVFQPFLRNLGFPVFAFGLLFAGINLIGTFSPLLSKVLVKKFKNEKNYLAFLLLCSIILDLLILLVTNAFYGIIILGLMFIVIDLFMPINSSYFQSFIPSKMRATITSFNGMVISLAYVISSPLSGLIADTIGPQKTIAMGAIFLIPALILYLKIRNKK